MQLMLPERGKPEGRLVFDQGPLVGRAYRLDPRICGSPICQCQEFTLHCHPEQSGEPPSPLTLELDLERRILLKPGLAEATPAADLAQAFLDEMTTTQWNYLQSYFRAVKILYTESANLDELDADFPTDASEGGMVAYYEILPFARPVHFTAGGYRWAFDDQYCLRPGCPCRHAVLQCSRIGPQSADAAPQGPDLLFRYHYDTQRFEAIEMAGAGLSPETLLDSMRQAQPDFDAFLSGRHAQLRRLYSRFLKRQGTSPLRSRGSVANASLAAPGNLPYEPVRAAQKPGRNDPCPCGSGLKYKKCCGRT